MDFLAGGAQVKTEIDVDALVSLSAKVGNGSRVWGLTQIRENAVVGAHCIVGRGVYIGPGVQIGSNCKIQNHALIYEPAIIGDGVFIGPAVVLTNDRFPRAVSTEGTLKSSADWTAEGVVVEDGVSIGASSVCVGPVRIGSSALVGAGSVVTRDVVPYALMVGAPARQVGWVGRAGRALVRKGSFFECPLTGEKYTESLGHLKLSDLS